MHVTVSSPKAMAIFHKISNYMPAQGSSHATEPSHSSWEGEGGKGVYTEFLSKAGGGEEPALCI